MQHVFAVGPIPDMIPLLTVWSICGLGCRWLGICISATLSVAWKGRNWPGNTTDLTLSLPRVPSISNFSCSLTMDLHHTVWRTWLFIAHSGEYDDTTNSHYLTYTFLFIRLGECNFLILGMKALKPKPLSDGSWSLETAKSAYSNVISLFFAPVAPHVTTRQFTPGQLQLAGGRWHTFHAQAQEVHSPNLLRRNV